MKINNRKTLGIKDFFQSMSQYLQREQKELFFHQKSEAEEREYFNFFKFLFESPDKKLEF